MWIIGGLAVAFFAGVGVGASLLARWGSSWGATQDEIEAEMAGDKLLADGPPGRALVRMTRAVTITTVPEKVWPWLAQLGRGAGWYSFDQLDNGGKPSANHLVPWIPEPRLGDATAIGYLSHIEPSRALTWWLPGPDELLGAKGRMCVDLRLEPRTYGSRLIIRVSFDAVGWTARLVTLLFVCVDSIMAVKQLLGIKRRAERFGLRATDPKRITTGERDQFQLYEVRYASGGHAGVSGAEKAAHWRKHAIAALGPAADSA